MCPRLQFLLRVSPTTEGGTGVTSASPRGNFALLSASFTLTSFTIL